MMNPSEEGGRGHLGMQYPLQPSCRKIPMDREFAGRSPSTWPVWLTLTLTCIENGNPPCLWESATGKRWRAAVVVSTYLILLKVTCSSRDNSPITSQVPGQHYRTFLSCIIEAEVLMFALSWRRFPEWLSKKASNWCVNEKDAKKHIRHQLHSNKSYHLIFPAVVLHQVYMLFILYKLIVWGAKSQDIKSRVCHPWIWRMKMVGKQARNVAWAKHKNNL